MQEEDDEAQHSQTPVSQNTMTQNLQILQSNTDEHLSISQRIQLQRVQQPVSNYQHMDVNDEQRRKSKIHGFTKFHYNKDLGDDGEEYIPANVNRNRLNFDPGCIGEDDDLQHLIENHKEVDREDTEIDFIQQIDTDREINNNNEGENYLPVVSDNQIQINSKHQEGIVEEILTKQQRERDNSLSSSAAGTKEGEKNRTKEFKNSKGTKHSSSNSKNSATVAKNQKGYAQKSHMEPSYTEVYVWGDDSQGQLGLELYNKQAITKDGQKQVKQYYEVPKSCSFNVIISQVSCGQAHSAMLTASGHLYMMGSNKYGQLGVVTQSTIANEEPELSAYKQHNESGDFQGTFRKAGQKSLSTMDDKNKNMRAPCLVDSLKQVFLQKVECGANYTIAMGEKRDSKSQKQKSAIHSQKFVYVWGSNINGQLGLGNLEEHTSTSNPTSLSEIVKNQPPTGMQSCIHQPTLMQNFPKNNEVLLDFSCGESHSLFKTQYGDKIFVYGTGLNQSGQCGLSTKTLSHLLAPTKITLLKAFADSVSQIKAGVNHSLFLCGKTGFVYQCGGLKQSMKTFEQILIQEPILSIEASLHSAALSCSGRLYVWSSNLEKIKGPIEIFNQSIKFPLQQLSLSKNFAVVLDNLGKTYIWDGQIQSFIKEVCESVDQSDQTNIPIQFKSLNTKFVKTMKSGEGFVIALGRDIPSKPIRSKSRPQLPSKRQLKSSHARKSSQKPDKEQQKAPINDFKIQMPQKIIDRIQNSQEKAEEAQRQIMYPSVNQLQKYQDPSQNPQSYPQVNLQPQNSRYFQHQGKMNMNINLFTAGQEQYQPSVNISEYNAEIIQKKSSKKSYSDIQSLQIASQPPPQKQLQKKKSAQTYKPYPQLQGHSQLPQMSKSKAHPSQSSIHNPNFQKPMQRNQPQSQNASTDKHHQKKKKMSSELQNLQNGLQSLAKPKSFRNGTENAVGTQPTTMSSGRQQQKTYKVNGVMACNRGIVSQGFLPPSKSLGVIDDKLGMKMNNANSVINSILKKQITSQDSSCRGINGIVSQEDSQSFIIHKSQSVSSVTKRQLKKHLAQQAQIQKKAKKGISSTKLSKPGSKSRPKLLVNQQSPNQFNQVNKSIMSAKSGMSDQSLSRSIKSINSINSQYKIGRSKEKLKSVKSIKSFNSKNMSQSRSKSRSPHSGSQSRIVQSMLLSGSLSHQINENMNLKNINIIDQHGDIKQMKSFDVGNNARLQNYAAQLGYINSQGAQNDYDVRPHSVSSAHKRSTNSRYSSGHYQRLLKEKSNSKNVSTQRKSSIPYNEKFECTKNSAGSVNLKVSHFGRGSSQGDDRTTGRINQSGIVEGDLNSKFINQLKAKIKVQKLEMRQLMDDNIKKDNNLQRLVHQVERFKRGLPYSAGFSPTSGSQSKEMPVLASSDAISQSFESNKQYKVEVNKLKLKLKKQNQTIRTLKDKFINQQNSLNNQQRQHHQSSDMATQLSAEFPHSSSQDLFVVTEQNVQLEQKMEQLRQEQQRSENLLRQMEELRSNLTEQIDKLTSKVSKKDGQLIQANQQLSELHGGIRDFQEQTHQIQNELVQKLQDLQKRYEQQIEINDKIRYQMQVLKKGSGLTKQETEEMKGELKNKDKQIELLKKENADLKSLVKQMSSQLEKQNYSDLLSKVGQVIRPVLQREAESAQKSRSVKRTTFKSQERVEKLIYSDRSTSKVSRHSNKSNKTKKNRKNNYDEVSQNSKKSYEKFEPKADIKEILSDKIRRKSLGVASNSPNRSFDRYQNTSLDRKNEPIQVYGVQSAYKNPNDPNSIPFNIHKVNQTNELNSQSGVLKKYIIPVHANKYAEGGSYLNRMEGFGDNSSHHSNSPQKQYFNMQQEKPVNMKDISISPQTRHNIHANAVALQDYRKSPSQPKRVTVQQTLKNQDPVSSPEKSETKPKSSKKEAKQGDSDQKQPSSAQKEQSIRELREKYNQLMRQSLERKAYQRQQSSKSRE